MRGLPRLLILAFLESLATVLIERGVYFYLASTLQFDDQSNLWLGLGMGSFYVIGALASYRFCQPWGEKRALQFVLLALLLLHGLLATPVPLPLFISVNLTLGLLTGMKWPIVESYISGGRTPTQTSRAVGWFNMSWATGVPLALFIAGPLIDAWPPGIFALSSAINAISLLLIVPLPGKVVHLAADHPERLPKEKLQLYSRMLVSSRWSMLAAYTLLFLLAPLAPGIFRRLGFSVNWATAIWGLVDVVRLGAFIVLQINPRWHGKRLPLVLAALGMPSGFFMILFGSSVPVVLAGQLLFGSVAGLSYYAALYYAMVVKNASVDAGGAHEGLIGAGLAIGPGMGLIGRALAAPLGGAIAGMLAGVGPFIVACTALSLWPLRGPKIIRPR